MKLNKLLYILLPVLVLSACKKYDFDQRSTGEAVGAFTLKSPATNTSLILNAATPGSQVVISWNASKPGLNTVVTYKWIAALKTGSLDAPVITLPSDNGGVTPQLTATQKQLDDALKAAGVADGAKADLQWTVLAENTTGTSVKASNIYSISITRFGDGVTPFLIYGPLSSTGNLEINPTSTADFIVFKWQKATPAKTANTVKYQLSFIKEDGTFSAPLFAVTPGNNGTDTTVQISWKQISDSLDKKGITDLSQVSKLKWSVQATSGNSTAWSAYENQLYILRKVSFYVVGSFTGWNIDAPLEIIVDKKPDRYSKVFYAYVQLTAGDEFKFVKTKGDWGSAYGNTGGSNGDYTTALNQGGNFQVAASGIYRLTIDVAASKAYVQQKQVGVVGNMQGWNQTAPLFGGYLKPNKFLIIVPSNGSDEFKLHEGPEWDNSTPNKTRWWGKGASAGVLDLDGNGGNLVASSTPRIRVIWDGTDPQQVKYDISNAFEMRVVGNGIQGVAEWTPGVSPQMNYLGNGKWQITLNLIGGKDIKFLAGNDWGVLDYEDAGGGKIKYEGGDNFKTPAASGSYTITLDEYNGTYTIN
jgi:starch-binding outer membrane protein SusE/F